MRTCNAACAHIWCLPCSPAPGALLQVAPVAGVRVPTIMAVCIVMKYFPNMIVIYSAMQCSVNKCHPRVVGNVSNGKPRDSHPNLPMCTLLTNFPTFPQLAPDLLQT